MKEYNKCYFKDLERFVEKEDFTKFDNKILLITGASGLIGSYFIDALLFDKTLNVKIYAVVRNLKKAKERFNIYENDNRLEFIEQDISKTFTVKIRFDYIFHLASYSDAQNYARYPVETMTINFCGLLNLLEYAKKTNNVKVFFASSSEVYGTSGEPMIEENVGEVNPVDVRSCYNEAKRASETLCISFMHEYNVKVFIGRFCRLYGPTMKLEDSKALSQFLMSAVKGQDIPLKSSGEQKYSYLYVSDAVSGMLKIMFEGVAGEAYNISEDEDILSLKEIATFVAKQGKVNIKFVNTTKEEKIGYSRAKNAVLISDKLRKLGWTSNVGLKDGIKRTIEILRCKIID